MCVRNVCEYEPDENKNDDVIFSSYGVMNIIGYIGYIGYRYR
jgi:hypothetical protein